MEFMPVVAGVLKGVVALFFFGNVVESYTRVRGGGDFNLVGDLYKTGLAAIITWGGWQAISLLG